MMRALIFGSLIGPVLAIYEQPGVSSPQESVLNSSGRLVTRLGNLTYRVPVSEPKQSESSKSGVIAAENTKRNDLPWSPGTLLLGRLKNQEDEIASREDRMTPANDLQSKDSKSGVLTLDSKPTDNSTSDRLRERIQQYLKELEYRELRLGRKDETKLAEIGAYVQYLAMGEDLADFEDTCSEADIVSMFRLQILLSSENLKRSVKGKNESGDETPDVQYIMRALKTNTPQFVKGLISETRNSFRFFCDESFLRTISWGAEYSFSSFLDSIVKSIHGENLTLQQLIVFESDSDNFDAEVAKEIKTPSDYLYIILPGAEEFDLTDKLKNIKGAEYSIIGIIRQEADDWSAFIKRDGIWFHLIETSVDTKYSETPPKAISGDAVIFEKI